MSVCQDVYVYAVCTLAEFGGGVNRGVNVVLC